MCETSDNREANDVVRGRAGATAAAPRWQNPYKSLIDAFPGRLFTLRERDEDCARVRALAEAAASAYCEIGSGSGRHLIEQASRAPGAAHFGFELRFKRAVRTIEKARDRGVENLYVLRTRGEEIAEIFAPATLDGVYVNFPEPWDKLKRRKHRVLSKEFLGHMDIVLSPAGFISVKTDHGSYYDDFLTIVAADGRFRIAEQSRDFGGSDCFDPALASEFENLFRHQGLPIHYVKLQRGNR